MAKTRRANAVMFGFDFQVNAAIILMLENIEDLSSLKLEGNYEDIEIVLQDGRYILAQAKAIERSSSDFSNVRKNLKNSLTSLSEAGQKVNADKLIFITNSPNPLNEIESRGIFYGEAHRTFSSLPDSSQKIIADYLTDIDQPLDTNKFTIQILPFETDNDIERYKVVRRNIDDFVGKLNISIPGIGEKLMSLWHEDIFINSTKKNAALIMNKKDIIWPIIIIATDVMRCDDTIAEWFDAGLYEEITHKYKELIDTHCERCEFFIKVLFDFKAFKPENTYASERCSAFAQSKWQDYLDEFELSNFNPETQKGLIQVVLYTIVRNRFAVDKIKRGANL